MCKEAAVSIWVPNFCFTTQKGLSPGVLYFSFSCWDKISWQRAPYGDRAVILSHKFGLQPMTLETSQ